MLEALEKTAIETTTIWTDHLTTFSGVPLKTVLDVGSVDGRFVKMVALNDYAVTIPITDIDEDTPIIATRMNGDLMPIRTKGPFWIVFPYDSDPKYRTETHYARSIWQLNRLIVTEG
jgi:hypothetical protein